MFQYINNLKQRLTKSGYNEYYIKLCEQYSTRLLQNRLPVIFDRKHFSLLLGLKEEYLKMLIILSDQLYNNVDIPKKLGGYRTIDIPIEGLKYVQRWILDNILYNIPTSTASTGFVPKKSIKENAEKHVNKDCVITFDIKDFFPTIKFEEVFRIFNYFGYTNDMSYVFAKLCTRLGSLPQGAPTSPYISNIACLKLDKRLLNLTQSLNANYTRYADDMTISGGRFLIKYLDLFKEIISEEGFVINNKKTNIKYRHDRQMVTGLVVNEKVSIPKKTKRYLRQQIYFCMKYGVSNHLNYIKCNKSNFKEHLYGLAYFIKMVESEEGDKFLNDLNMITWDY